MPRVSADYLAERRAHILDAARRCFVRNGFHATSMQDVFAESGLSAGAIYRYFAGKDEMILAIAADNIRDVALAVRAVADAGDSASLGDALAAAIDVIDEKDFDGQLGKLAVQVWSEALRNPALKADFRALVADTTAGLQDVVRSHQAAGRLTAHADPAAVARVVLAVLPGYLVQRALLDTPSDAAMKAAVRALWP